MVYLTAIALLGISVVPAHAYIDPGSGSYVLQLMLAGILAAAFSLKMYWQRLKASIARRFTANIPARADRN